MPVSQPSELGSDDPEPHDNIATRSAELRDLIERRSPRMRHTDGADLLITALERVATCEDSELVACAAEVSERLRLLFYASVGRRPPSDLRSAPTYVSSVQRRYHMSSRNAAREALAHVEGYRTWRDLMHGALRLDSK